MVIRDYNLLLSGNGNKVRRWIYSYYLKAVKNYKEVFQLIHTTKIERFNSRSYFYYINSGINPLTIAVDLSRLPPVVVEG